MLRSVLVFFVLFGSLYAEPLQDKEEMTHLGAALQEKLKELTTEIDATTQELKNERIQASNLEMEAQKHLPNDWDVYAMKIEESENHERNANILEARLKQIIQEKQDIENNIKNAP
jgi:RNA polymerase-binding transcription factor DksA